MVRWLTASILVWERRYSLTSVPSSTGVSVGSSIVSKTGRACSSYMNLILSNLSVLANRCRNHPPLGRRELDHRRKAHSLLWSTSPQDPFYPSGLIFGFTQNFETITLFLSVLLVNLLITDGKVRRQSSTTPISEKKNLITLLSPFNSLIGLKDSC